MRILIVDDSQTMRQMLKLYLCGVADDTCECADGAEALAAYTEFLPDWVLMDWMMKRVDGLAATKQIIQSFPEAQILFVTQYDDAEVRGAAQEAGVSGFVRKDDLFALREFFAADISGKSGSPASTGVSTQIQNLMSNQMS